jgi:hypothetical protein
MDDFSADYGSLVLAETARRAWAVEQAVRSRGSADGDESSYAIGEATLEIADRYLSYLETPRREADARLLAVARMWDGTGDAGPLIGALADALERIGRGG